MIARNMSLPAGSFFLFGPRGTGKSTWVEAALPQALRIDLLRESTFAELAGHADRLEAMADGQAATSIILDEVQKLPAILDEVHRLIEHAVHWGMLPTVWTGPDPDGYLRGYVGTYLREEVQQEALVRNIGSFSRFLEAASFSQAAVLNVQTVAADCAINRKTVENHFDLLEDLCGPADRWIATTRSTVQLSRRWFSNACARKMPTTIWATRSATGVP